MANTPITLDRFSGIDLRRDPTELGLSDAAFAKNVDFDGGQPRRRLGTRIFNAKSAQEGELTEYRQYSSLAVLGGVPGAMTSTDATSPGTAASTGSAPWTNPSNATSSNDSYATQLATSTDALLLTNFGFAIPSGSEINGIKVEVEGKGDGAGVRPVKNGAVVDPPPGPPGSYAEQSFAASDAIYTYGSSDALWNLEWTAEEINDSTWGVGIFQIARGDDTSVDHVRVTIYYTETPASAEVFAVWDDGVDEWYIDRLSVSDGTLLGDSSATGPINRDSGGVAESMRFARIGTDAASYIFASGGPSNVEALTLWDGTNFTTGGFTGTAPMGSGVAVTPWDNRLVNGGGDDGVWAHKVIFSDEGAPLTMSADNFVLLHPGDSERIVEIVSWDNLVFVFKQSKFFVFYGTSTDSAGGPVFEYRAVVGEGCANSTAQKKHVAVARDAVYFVNDGGVWATTGGEPRLVSQKIDALFTGGVTANPYMPIAPAAPAGLWHAHGKLYLTFEGSNLVLVYEITQGQWSVYDLPEGELFDVAEDRITGVRRTLFSLSGLDIHEMREDLTLDGARNEVQSVSCGGGTAGTFKLAYAGQVTANINYNDTAAEVQTALEALSNIAVGDIVCWGGPLPGNVYIQWIGPQAETDIAAITVDTEAVTNGDATVWQHRTGQAGSPIACEWISGASDLGYDADKVVKELYVTATDGTLGAAVSTELGDFPATSEEHTFTDTETLRYRAAATNVKGRLLSLKLTNSTASEDASEFNPQRVTLNLLGNRGGPQEGSGT